MSDGDEFRGADPIRSRNPQQPDPGEDAGPAGWLDALNSFLDRALKADIDTGC